jgi:excinuclease UvrABC ATPase subunit
MPTLTGDIVANWKKYSIATSDAGRTLILKLAGTNLTNADLDSVIGYLTTSHGVSGSGDSAFTVAGVGTADGSAFVSGTTDTVFLKIQGTGDVTVATADMGISGLTITVEAIFTPAL